MKTIHRSTVAITFALMIGCGPLRSNDSQPNVPEPVDAPAELPDERARARFGEAFAAFAQAKQDGMSPAECQAIAERFDEVYSSSPSSMLVARFNVGAVWEECGELDKALEIYQELAEANFHLAFNNLGVIAWKQGDTKRALELFERAVEADEKRAFWARNNLAAAHRDRYTDTVEAQDFGVAEKQIQNVLAVDTSNRAAYENLARLYYDRGRLEDRSYLLLADLVVTQALRVLEKENQQSADIWNLRGLLFMQDDNQVDALRAFQNAVAIDPRHADANRNIGFIAIRFRDYDAAEAAFEAALEVDEVERDVEVYIGLGVAKRGLRKFADAEHWYAEAASLAPDDPRPWYNLGILNQEHLSGQDDIEQPTIERYYEVAKRHYGKFIDLAKDQREYADAVADAKARVQIIDEAIAAFRELEIIEERAQRWAEEAALKEKRRREDLLRREREAAAAGQPSPSEVEEREAEAEAAKRRAEREAEQQAARERARIAEEE